MTLDLLEASYREPLRLAELRRQFLQDDHVPLPGLLTPQVQALIAAEVNRLQEMATNRDFRMPGYDTPRLMETLGGRQISRQSSTLAGLYAHDEIRKLVAEIVGGPLYPCHHPDEFMVLNYLSKSGSTHGWHLDDPAYALVIVLDAPPPGEGGVVEIIPNWTSLCRGLGVPVGEEVERTVRRCRERNLIKAFHYRSGEAYLLRSDRCLHRVTELAPRRQRKALNLGFEATATPQYGITATRLYGETDPG